jgi:hypothetical protein
MNTFYNLQPTQEIPMPACKTKVWTPTAACLPTPEQRVIWTGRGGRQQHGLYDQEGHWIADLDENDRRPWATTEQPSVWRAEP